MNYYYIIYKVDIPFKKKEIKKKLEKSNLLYLIKIFIYLGYPFGENIFPNSKTLYYYFKSNKYAKLIVYKIKDNSIINLTKLQGKDKEIINKINFYIKILINIYNTKEGKVTLIILNSRFRSSRVNLNYVKIFDNMSYKSCNKKVKGIKEYKNYIQYIYFIIFFKITSNYFIKTYIYIYIMPNLIQPLLLRNNFLILLRILIANYWERLIFEKSLNKDRKSLEITIKVKIKHRFK